MKFALTGLLLLGMLTRGWAQSDYLKFTDYTMGQPLINPAAIGLDAGVAGVLMYQSCFETTDLRPNTGIFNINSALKNKGLAGGVSFIYDKYGPYEKLSAYLQGSYKLKVNEGKFLFFGLQAGLNYVSNDPSKYNLKDDEPLLQQQVKLSQPNIGFGLHFVTEKYYLGLALPELLYNYVNNNGDKESGLISEKLRFFAYGGVKLNMSANVKLEPYTYWVYSEMDDLQVDIGGRLWYKDLFTFGLQYRTKQSVGVMARVRLLDELWLGYAFENDSEAAVNFNSRQEIGLTFRFGKGKKKMDGGSGGVNDVYDNTINSVRYF